MRNINKAHEPASLTAFRALNPTDYNGYPDKDELRESLVAEQRGICCYCESRIKPEIGSIRIEHWASQSAHRDLRLVYGNLLGACMGLEGDPEEDKHCDVYKADKNLCRNPADPGHDVEVVLRFLSDGTITSSNDLLNTVLNLNHPFLVSSRKSALTSFIKYVQIRGDVLTQRHGWERILEECTGANDNEDLKPYCSVLTYWARKHLARR
jgi:uncharacterized protein (TIGR02646 family)